MSYDRYRDDIRIQLLRATLVSTDDSGVQQLNALTGLASHPIGEAVRSQHFGLSSNPPAGSEGLLLALGGGFDRGHILGLEHPQHRPTNTPIGGTVLYDAGGNAVSLIMNKIRIVSPAAIEITAPSIKLTGTVDINN